MNPNDAYVLFMAIALPIAGWMFFRKLPGACRYYQAAFLSDAIRDHERESARLFLLAKTLDEEGVNADEERSRAQHHLSQARSLRADLAAIGKGASRDT